ncbi:MAG TPA: VCBS repeat-containing protein [Pyrinomonadaceae bacterium]|jgi:hypothetical protein
MNFVNPRPAGRQLLPALLLPVLLICLSDKTPAQSISFSSPVTYASGGTTAAAITTGDFDGDGKADLAIADQDSSDVGIMLGNGDGTFSTASTFSAGYSPRAVAASDLDADGKLDLVVGNETGNDLSVLMGNGDGTFQSAVSYGSITYPEHIAIADLNMDGKPDLAVAGFGGSVFVLMGNGDGTFQSPASYTTGTASTSVTVGDFDADGKPDLAVSNQDSSDLSVLINSGTGTFSTAVNYSTGPHPVSISAGDFNQDGKLDLVTADIGPISGGYITGDGYASVLLGNGDGTFQTTVDYAVGTLPHSVAVGDLDADGLPELVVANAYGDSVSILNGNGDGTFDAASNFDTGTFSIPFSVTLGDFNGDGKPDIATADYFGSSASVLINQT